MCFNLPQPIDKLDDKLSEVSFSLSVVECTSFIELNFLVKPTDDEFNIEDFLIVDQLHESSGILLEIWVFDHEKLNDRLE